MTNALTAPTPDDLREQEQTLFLVRTSTPQQRLAWLETMLIAIGPERIESHRNRVLDLAASHSR